jgi:hypothetical protein
VNREGRRVGRVKSLGVEMKEGGKDCDEIAIDERVCLVLKFVLKK